MSSAARGRDTNFLLVSRIPFNLQRRNIFRAFREAYGVGTGELFSFEIEGTSPQCDIIVYDRMKMPVFGKQTTVQQIPIEGVFAVIEVRSVIDTNALKDAGRKFQAIRDLWTSAYPLAGKENDEEGPSFFLFGFKWMTTEKSCLRFLKSSGEEDCTLVALDSGSSIWVGPTDRSKAARPVWLQNTDPEIGVYSTLAFFFFGVLSLSSKTCYFGALGKNCSGLLAMFLFLLFTIIPSVSAKAQSSPFAGQYSGEWTSRFVNEYTSRNGKTELTGTWNVSITSGGEVFGTEYNNGSGVTESFSGEIGDDGYLKVYLKGKTKTSIIQGRLRQRGNTLTGNLEQLCDYGVACLAIEIKLTRNSLGQGGSTNFPKRNTNTSDCLPKQGSLIIKMKDGSKKLIDLSEAETITVVP